MATSQNLSPNNSDVIQDLAAGRLRADGVEVDDDAGRFMAGEERCFLMAFRHRVALRSFFSVGVLIQVPQVFASHHLVVPAPICQNKEPLALLAP